ncbi:MAG: hypothetical protein KF838_09360 [Phycisphaeraceae bacterium]|nr:MAG: hypothetical protein KF838_09360 [Phycisphaeraceae bacterium]
MALRHQGITEQAKAAFHRKRDSRALFDDGANHTRGAMYIGGYAIECKIKAKSMEIYKCRSLSELRAKRELSEDQVFIHGLESLIVNLLPNDVSKRLRAGSAWRAFTSQVNLWSPQWRYRQDNPSREAALNFLDAVDEVWNWLEKNV